MRELTFGLGCRRKNALAVTDFPVFQEAIVRAIPPSSGLLLIALLDAFGEIFLEARERAMVAAFLVNKPLGGCVESVVTLETQRLADRASDRDLLADVDFFFLGERAGIATSRSN